MLTVPRNYRWVFSPPALLAGIMLSSLFLLSSGDDRLSQLEKIQARGHLTMITRNGATSWYLGRDGNTGFEYELAKGFAEYLQVELQIKPAEKFQDLFPMLETAAGDLIAANISRTPEREQVMQFGPDYENVESVVVYRRGYKKPREIKDLLGNRVRVIAGSSHAEALRLAQIENPQLRWQADPESSAEDLFLAIAEGIIDYAIVDSLAYDINQSYFPLVKRGFSLGESRPLAWVIAAEDRSIIEASQKYFAEIQANNKLADLKQSYYNQSSNLNYVGMYTFMNQMEKHMSVVLPIFMEVGQIHNMEWELLAAIGYQESRWDPAAVSRTGVRGIMMLTKPTAKSLGVTDREDPTQSIEGGTRYIKKMLNKVPARIGMPDRLWMALAAYNIGFGHLEDARKLAQGQGLDPDNWEDVRDTLPLLSQEKWFSKTRHGYARGYEAVDYVDNIKKYYEALRWMSDRNHPALDNDSLST